MTDRGGGTGFKAVAWPPVVVAAMLIFDATAASALPQLGPVPAAPPLRMAADVAPSAPAGPQDAAPLADLNEALAAARAKLEQLDRATAALAGVATLRADLAAREEENHRLRAEVQMLRERRAEWQRSEDAAKAQIAGLSQALDEAAADTKRFEGELADLRWQNAQLGTNLSEARAAEEAARADLGRQVEELIARVETSETEIERLNKELAGRSEELVAAAEAERRGAARIAELEDAVATAKEDLRSLGIRLTASAERLNEVNAALAVAERERDTALSAWDEEQARADRLRDTLAVAEAELEQVKIANRDLELRSASLEQAATAATDAAWQNLRAVESQIAALNSTLADAELVPSANAGPAATATGGASGAASGPAPEAEAQVPPTAAAGAIESSALAPAAGPTRPAKGEMALVKRTETKDPASIGPLAMLTDDLSVEGRIQAQSLLADLEAEIDPQGLKLIVPGAELFTVNSEEVRNSAHDSLAKVAELINLYKDQPVMIIGHTDAVGETEYNETLSLRRASLVRQFFIENFGIGAERLATQGRGEQEPIASNATAAGRRANRRVEVLILK